jgi:hypothetical protein
MTNYLADIMRAIDTMQAEGYTAEEVAAAMRFILHIYKTGNIVDAVDKYKSAVPDEQRALNLAARTMDLIKP